MSAKKDVVSWKDQMAAAAQAVQQQETPALGYISLRGGTMTYAGEEVPDNTLDVIVLAASYDRTFYDRPFDPDDQSPPDCYARGLHEAALVPASNVSSPVHESCSTCPNAQFGSAAVGKGQACKMRRRLALAPADGGDSMAIVATPPTSNVNWSKYANRVATGMQLPPWGVRTRMKLVPFKTYFKLEFECLGPVEEDLLPAIHKKVGEAEELLCQEIELEEDSDKY